MSKREERKVKRWKVPEESAIFPRKRFFDSCLKRPWFTRVLKIEIRWRRKRVYIHHFFLDFFIWESLETGPPFIVLERHYLIHLKKLLTKSTEGNEDEGIDMKEWRNRRHTFPAKDFISPRNTHETTSDDIPGKSDINCNIAFWIFVGASVVVVELGIWSC